MKFSLILVCLLSTTLLAEGRVRLPPHLRNRLTTPSPGDNGDCPSCEPPPEKQPCLLQAMGCIVNNAFGERQWYPDPCTLCDCVGCTKIECPVLNCFGYPQLTKPGKCCPECDFGVSEHNCSIVPAKVRSLYVSLGERSCQSNIILHGCNLKYGLEEDGEAFKCLPNETVVSFNTSAECMRYAGVHQIQFSDVFECTKVRIKDTRSNGFPQDIVVGGDGNSGLPQRCINYFARQQQP